MKIDITKKEKELLILIDKIYYFGLFKNLEIARTEEKEEELRDALMSLVKGKKMKIDVTKKEKELLILIDKIYYFGLFKNLEIARTEEKEEELRDALMSLVNKLKDMK